MRFSIIKAILSWQAWKKPTYRRSIRNRQHRRQKPRPLLPKRNSRKQRRTRKLMKRQRYKRPEQSKHKFKHILIQSTLGICYLWVTYEVVMASFLLE